MQCPCAAARPPPPCGGTYLPALRAGGRGAATLMQCRCAAARRLLRCGDTYVRAISETGEASSYNPVARGQPGTHDRLGVVLRPELEVAYRHGVTRLHDVSEW